VWKRRPAHQGHLLTGGFFRYARHINYFGDMVLFTGWVLMTGRPVLLAMPTLMLCGFVFLNVPAQDRYLEETYGEEYRSYGKRTAQLILYMTPLCQRLHPDHGRRFDPDALILHLLVLRNEIVSATPLKSCSGFAAGSGG
jgi:hypothetical protein